MPPPAPSCIIHLDGPYAGWGFDYATGERAGPIDLIAQATGLSDSALFDEAARIAGMDHPAPRPAPRPKPDHSAEVARLVDGAQPLAGTVGEVYLQARGLGDPGCPDLLFHPDLPDFDTRRGWPGLIALPRVVTGDRAPGIHRTHTFQSGSWTLPSMAIETAMPEVPRYAMYSGVVLDQLSWQMQRSGLLTATARLVAQGETVATTSGAGTPAELDLIRFGHFNGAIKRNGTALGNVISTEITYANNLDRIETIRADGMIDGADPSIAALTGRTEVRFADSTLVSQAISGAPCELEFAYGLTSGQSFTFTAHAVYLPRPRIEISGPQGVQASFDWQAARDAALGRMCTAVLVNDIESY